MSGILPEDPSYSLIAFLGFFVRKAKLPQVATIMPFAIRRDDGTGQFVPCQSRFSRHDVVLDSFVLTVEIESAIARLFVVGDPTVITSADSVQVPAGDWIGKIASEGTVFVIRGHLLIDVCFEVANLGRHDDANDVVSHDV